MKDHQTIVFYKFQWTCVGISYFVEVINSFNVL